MTILVIGSGGMLGHMTTLYLSEQGYDVVDISHTRKCRSNTLLMDMLEIDKMQKFLEKNKFDVIINCMAILTSQCERNKKNAIFLNSFFPHFLEEFYKESTTRIIQVSTGGVYSGKDAPYGESALHDTLNFYGKSKSMGEIINEKDLTIRSDFVGPDMSVNGKGLFNWIMNASGTVSGYSKAFFNGVTSLEFAKFVDLAITDKMTGSYNLHTGERISKYEFLKLVCDVFEKQNIDILASDAVCADMSLKTERADIAYTHTSMENQLEEIKEWIYCHKDIYTHYFN